MTHAVESRPDPDTSPADPPPLGSGSVAWSVFGDLTFVLGASRRLLLDVAHPIVATGVREFSVFESDPYGRALRTLDMIMGVVYGQEEALATARRLRDLHRPIKGTNSDGSRWSSLNPEAFHWVHASLVHGVYTQQKLLGRGWRPGEVEQFYLEMRQVGRLYGVREQDMPADWASFRTWFSEMTATRLERSDVTDRVLTVVGSPQPPPNPLLGNHFLWNHTARPIAGRVLTLITGGLLPAELREMLGVRWSRNHDLAFGTLAAVSRTVLPRLPRPIRMVPQARRALRRAEHDARSRPTAGARVVDVRSTDGTRLHAEIHGPDEAPTIVLAHGILCSTQFWRNQIRDLRDDYRVVAYDHRGHGRSDAPRSGSYELDHLVDDLQSVLAATVPDGQQAVVAGHSMGGIAVMSWAQKYRTDAAARVSAVALVNTTPGTVVDHVRFLRGPERTLVLRRRVARAVAPAARVPLPRRLPLRRHLLAHVAVGAGADPSIGREVDAILAATSARGRGGYGALLVNMVTDVDPSHVPVPAVVIAGRHDRIAPPARSRAITARLQHPLGLHELDSGHCGPLERPDEVTAVLRDLLETHR